MSSIKLFESKMIRSVWDEARKQWYFCVSDVVEALTDSANVREYIKKMRKREPELNSNWGTMCPPLELLAPDGKRRKTQCANVEGLLTAEISRVTFGMTPSEYREFKSLGKQGDNLRDHMTDLELIFTMLGEASTTEIARNKDAKGFGENRHSAIEGGAVAGNARLDLEKKSGRRVSSRANFKELPETIMRKKLAGEKE